MGVSVLCVNPQILHFRSLMPKAFYLSGDGYVSFDTKPLIHRLTSDQVANGCGIPNMYMQGFRCRVVGSTGDAALATAAPPVWCEDDPKKCTKGAKQVSPKLSSCLEFSCLSDPGKMVYWHQLEGNNVVVDGYDLSGQPKSPSYNGKMGFADGESAAKTLFQSGTHDVKCNRRTD